MIGGMLMTGAGGTGYGHLLVQAEPYSRSVVVLDHRGSATYADNVELVVGDGASLSVNSLQDWNADAVHQHGRWMSPNHYDAASGWLKLSIHSWLLKIGGKTILIDTCVGNHKSRKHRPKWDMMNTPYLDRLKAAGVTPEQVDMVMCTHLHVDHVGWNTRLENGRWVPTFPKARYVFGKKEFDYWTETHAKTPVPPFGDSVLPVVEARQSATALQRRVALR